jgi:hypothetical protein
MAAGQNYLRLDWIKDAQLRATVESNANLMENMRRSGTMSYNHWYSESRLCSDEYVSEAWDHLLAHPPDFELLIRHDGYLHVPDPL